ncbi:hypothetical protein OH76DRAFT_883713 [Lentinus brumalis]|uniref:Uncharacterized protein n=1 Tax=Lentinus brumalis TaxID=2498619 RepID=A0A371D1F0_9APHY|nr:hypothetical protein OH76DRAFT_883713 [Polyporus brumalis]
MVTTITTPRREIAWPGSVRIDVLDQSKGPLADKYVRPHRAPSDKCHPTADLRRRKSHAWTTHSDVCPQQACRRLRKRELELGPQHNPYTWNQRPSSVRGDTQICQTTDVLFRSSYALYSWHSVLTARAHRRSQNEVEGPPNRHRVTAGKPHTVFCSRTGACCGRP